MAEQARTARQMNTLRDALERYNNSFIYALRGAYSSFSAAKEQAWFDCVKLMRDRGGHSIKIIGANTFTFSAGFYFADEQGRPNFMYVTRDNAIYAPVDEIKEVTR